MSVVVANTSPNISITQTGTLGTASGTPLPAGLSALRGSFLNGSLADQVALVHSRTYNFAASTPQTPDLTALLDILGAALSFAVIRFLAYRIQSSNPAFVLTVGGAGANEWNGWLTSGSKAVWYPSTLVNDGYTIIQAPSLTGMPVNAGSKLFKMDPGTNAVGLVDFILFGS